MLPLTNSDVVSSNGGPRRRNMRSGSNTNDHNGSNHNVMARRASAYIPKWSKSSRANKSTASKKLTAIGLFLVLTVLLCVTLIMVRGLDGLYRQEILQPSEPRHPHILCLAGLLDNIFYLFSL